MKKHYQPIKIVVNPLSQYDDVLTNSQEFGTKVQSRGEDFGGIIDENEWQ